MSQAAAELRTLPAAAEPLPETLPLLHQPLVQAVLCLAGYLLHVLVLSRRNLPLPGTGTSLGLDTLAGLAVLAAAMKRRTANGRSLLPSWLIGGSRRRLEDREPEEQLVGDLSQEPGRAKFAWIATCVGMLLWPFLFSMFFAHIIEVVLSLMVIFGVPINNFNRMLSSKLIVEQLVFNLVLGKVVAVRHPDFFTKRFVRCRWRGPWLAPVLGGYAASLALFNLVEPLNQALLPSLNYLPEGFVAQLANPADGKLSSLLLASVAPCLGAPVFEELQTRALLLQALTAVMPLRNAVLLQGFIFGAQHCQIGLVLPLATTGIFWGILYVHSGNLLVPMLIHALWNLRIFLGSYLGL